MKKHTSHKRLHLQHESIRQLSRDSLDLVAGGDSGSLSCSGPDCPRITSECSQRPSLPVAICHLAG